VILDRSSENAVYNDYSQIFQNRVLMVPILHEERFLALLEEVNLAGYVPGQEPAK
jgi:hypothetical protein